MTPRRMGVFVGLVVGLLGPASSLSAQEENIPLLAADLSASSPPVRIGEPMPTWWEIQKYQPGLLEGRFSFRVHLGSEEFYRYTTDEVVLHEPDHRLRFLFPPIITNLRAPEIEIDVAWLPKDGGTAIPLRPQLLRVPFNAQRTLLLGVIERRRGLSRSPDWNDRLNNLMLEQHAQPPEPTQFFPNAAAIMQQTPLQTVLIGWTAEESPPDPHALLSYDAIAIGEGEFAQLRRPQLLAIRHWVSGGGSLYLEPNGVLEAPHLECLTELTRERQPAVDWRVDGTGQLAWELITDHGVIATDCGLGRVVILDPQRHPEPAPAELVSEVWRMPPRTDAHRWIQQERFAMPAMGGWRQDNVRSNPKLALIEAIESMLRPESVRLVPLPLVGGLLTGLVLLIGPIDWWWLGRIQRRRWTWITWPVWTVTVTLLLVGLSNWYLQSTEPPEELVIHDVDPSGRIVRTLEFRLTFPSRTRPVGRDVAAAIWVPLGNGRPDPVSQLPPTGTNAATFRDFDHRRVTQLPELVGRFPTSYSATQPLVQWVSELSMVYRLPTAEEPPMSPLDWPVLLKALGARRDVLPEEVVTAASRQLEGSVWVCLMQTVGGQPEGFSPMADRPFRNRRVIPLFRGLTLPPGAAGTTRLSGPWQGDLLRQIFLYPLAEGRASAALLVAHQTGDHQTTVYRRLIPRRVTF